MENYDTTRPIWNTMSGKYPNYGATKAPPSYGGKMPMKGLSQPQTWYTHISGSTGKKPMYGAGKSPSSSEHHPHAVGWKRPPYSSSGAHTSVGEKFYHPASKTIPGPYSQQAFDKSTAFHDIYEHDSQAQPESEFRTENTRLLPCPAAATDLDLLGPRQEAMAQAAVPPRGMGLTSKLRQKRQKRDEAEWERHKPIMADFYLKANKSLNQLRDHMRETFRFEASPKQYKDQFATWGWSKYFSHNLALYMSDKHNRRSQQGKTGTQFVWRGCVTSIEAARKLLTEEELQRSRNEALTMPTPKTPFGMEVETPSAAENALSLPPSPLFNEPEGTEQLDAGDTLHLTDPVPSRQAQGMTDPDPSLVVKIRHNGHTIQDLTQLLHAVRESEDNADLNQAEGFYTRLLDVARHLLTPATAEHRKLVYEASCFYARHDKMGDVDRLLDQLSKDCVAKWGVAHEQTLTHYGVVGKMLAQWGRQKDAAGLVKRTLDRVQGLVTESSPAGRNSETWTDDASYRSQRDTSNSNDGDPTVPTNFALLQEQLRFDTRLEADDNAAPIQRLLTLLSRLENKAESCPSETLHTHVLLVQYYTSTRMSRACLAELKRAEEKAIAFCKSGPEKRLPKPFFHRAITLVRSMFELGREMEAEKLLWQLQSRVSDDYGDDHTDAITIFVAMGRMCEQQLRRWDLARPRFEAAFAGAITRFGIQAPVTRRLETCLEEGRYPSTRAETLEGDEGVLAVLAL